MARGRGKKRSRNLDVRNLSKKQRNHLKEFGEAHPAEEIDNTKRFKKVFDEDDNGSGVKEQVDPSSSDESDDEAPNAYNHLISTLTTKTSSHDALSESSSDDSGDDETMVNENEEEDHKDDKLVEDDYRNEEDQTDEEVDEDVTDSFIKHFENEINDQFGKDLKENPAWKKQSITLPLIGDCTLSLHEKAPKMLPNTKEKNLKKLHVKQKLISNIPAANNKITGINGTSKESLSAFQRSIFSVINQYQDLYYCERNSSNGEEIRLLYCMHAINHVLKTRSRVIAHNNKMKTKKETGLEDYRDQGLTRPKVLIVVPFRNSALRIVAMMMDLLLGDDHSNVLNKKRFFKEFSSKDASTSGKKPDDYYETFYGNTDDHFRIGLGIAKRTLKLYTEFYSSDIILASPLGLRTILAGEDDDAQKGEHDFLSSIEVMIMDQVDIFLMQNWEHIHYIFDHLHLQPKDSHGVDFSRVRMWALEGLSKFYRQTLLFSSVQCPEVNAVFNKLCHNYAGKIAIPRSVVPGSISQVAVTLSQVFQRLDVQSPQQVPDARFGYFTKKILPQYKDQLMGHTLIFVPSYFDFVRIRNYMKREELSSVLLCEYSKDEYIDRSRSAFYHSLKHFMVYTERLHFYRRFHLKGVKHIIFYELPMYPHFYNELCNMLSAPKGKKGVEKNSNFTCSVLYSKYDAQRLASVVGTERASSMLSSEKLVHMLVTGDEEVS